MENTVENQLNYAGFWRRFGAHWIDIAIFLPLSALVIYLENQFRLFNLLWIIPGSVIGIIFHVYLVERYGGTPGKLAMKTRISMVDGSAVTRKAAILRYSVLFSLSTLQGIGIVISTAYMSNEIYHSLGFVERSQVLMEQAPFWTQPVGILIQVWILSEFVTMLFNKRRRAIHDYIAGTVVVRTGATV